MSTTAVFGHPPLALADVPAGAVQTSPLVPGSQALEAFAPGSLSEILMLAPPATVERRGALAAALRALSPEGRLIAMAPKDKGGSRLAGDLTALPALLAGVEPTLKITATSKPDATGFSILALSTERDEELGEPLLQALVAQNFRVRALSR
eukprot:gene31401-32021_t